MKYGVVGNHAYDVAHVQGSAGDGLEPDYNMENNPLYEMRIKSNERHSHKTETAAGTGVYENVALWDTPLCFLIIKLIMTVPST